MLIRFTTENDKENWLSLAKDVGEIFRAPDMINDPDFHRYMEAKIRKNESLIALNRMSRECNGVISFSKTHNRITWLGVFEKYRRHGAGSKLLRCALNQLDWDKNITVETYSEEYIPGEPARNLYKKFGFIDIDKSLSDKLNNPIWKMVLPASKNKKRGGFHYNFDIYKKWSNSENCPVCRKEQPLHPPVLIKELEHSWVECYAEAQGTLFGKCHVLSKIHSEHFYDLERDKMANFMNDVQKVAEALHKVTDAVKINYEIHGNSMPHLHVHLFPRYIDDIFPSAPIDYRIVEPSPYESQEEFDWFIEKMRNSLYIR